MITFFGTFVCYVHCVIRTIPFRVFSFCIYIAVYYCCFCVCVLSSSSRDAQASHISSCPSSAAYDGKGKGVIDYSACN